MAKIYYDLIKKNLKTTDDVPLRWKEQVQELLNTQN
ncbi:CD1375 family protein [Paenibacillus sanguinis]|nr:CD1375 family protein [Paenibacillus sanguinis]